MAQKRKYTLDNTNKETLNPIYELGFKVNL